MTDLWMPTAVRHPLSSGPMANNGGGKKVTWHITWDKNASAGAPADLLPYGNLVGYFGGAGAGMAPHILWNPFTGEITQYFAADQFSKSLVNAAGGVETNRQGEMNIQVESLFFPYCRVNGKVYATLADTPCVGLPALMQWFRGLGVPDTWPMGAPTWAPNRSAHVWSTMGGHYGHSQVPENDHTDPGIMPPLFSIPGSPGPVHDPGLPPARLTFNRTLVNYTEGADVMEWQRYMHDVRTWTGITKDGKYGAQSEHYCRLFQQDCNDNGWNVGDVDGKAGPHTIHAMLHRPITK